MEEVHMSILKRNNEKSSTLDLFRVKMDDLFDDFFGTSSLSLKTTGFTPKVDITEDEKHVKIKAELPGLEEKDIHVELRENILTISGEKKEEKETKSEKEHRVERSYGSFSRSFTLPKSVEADKIKAKFKNGLLDIVVPKGKELEDKKVKIAIN